MVAPVMLPSQMEASAEAVPPPVEEPPPPPTVIDLFIAGYRDSGGPEDKLEHIVTRVIPCESSGNPYAVSPAGPYYGLMQFVGATWRAAGGGDWADPYQQGANTAWLLGKANPSTQWPVCWLKR